MRHALPLIALTLLAPRAADACAACACGDPTLTTMGAGKSFAGRLRLSGEWRHRAEEIPTAFGPARVTEDRYTLAAAYAPFETVQLAVSLPLVDRALATPTLARDRAFGLGDVELLGRWFLAGTRGFEAHQLGLTAGLRLPTGPELTGADGAPLPLDAQPGNGAFMPSVGAWYGLFAHPYSAHLSLTAIVPLEGHQGFAPGPAGLATAYVQRQWQTTLAVRLGLDGRLAGADRQRSETLDDTGGTTVFAAPGLSYSPLIDVLLHATLRWPLYDSRREQAEPSLSVGVIYDL